MKFKYVGPDEEITLREITFSKGKAVDVECENLQSKLEALDEFQAVKPRGKRNDKNPD